MRGLGPIQPVGSVRNGHLATLGLAPLDTTRTHWRRPGRDHRQRVRDSLRGVRFSCGAAVSAARSRTQAVAAAVQARRLHHKKPPEPPRTHGHLRCRALAAASVRSFLEGRHAATSSIPAPIFPLRVAKRAHAGNARPAGRSPRLAAVSSPMTRSRSPSGCFSSATRGDEPFLAFLPIVPVRQECLQFRPAHFARCLEEMSSVAPSVAKNPILTRFQEPPSVHHAPGWKCGVRLRRRLARRVRDSFRGVRFSCGAAVSAARSRPQAVPAAVQARRLHHKKPPKTSRTLARPFGGDSVAFPAETG